MNAAVKDIDNQLHAQKGIQDLIRCLLNSKNHNDHEALETMLLHSTRTTALLTTLKLQIIATTAASN